MTGGDGDDRYVLTSVSHSAAQDAMADRITDFVQGEDRIDLSAIDAKSTNTNPDDAFVFLGDKPFTNVAGQLIYTVDTNKHFTYIRLDVNGDGVADAAIRLNGEYVLNAGDFLL